MIQNGILGTITTMRTPGLVSLGIRSMPAGKTPTCVGRCALASRHGVLPRSNGSLGGVAGSLVDTLRHHCLAGFVTRSSHGRELLY